MAKQEYRDAQLGWKPRLDNADFALERIDIARKRGALDAANRVVVGDNPYHPSDARHWAWKDGWVETRKTMRP